MKRQIALWRSGQKIFDESHKVESLLQLL